QRHSPRSGRREVPHQGDGAGELGAGGGGQQGFADAVGELRAALAAAVPVDQPAHEDLGEVVRPGLRHDPAPQLLHEVELERDGGELGGEAAGCRGGEGEEAAYGGGRGAREAGGAQSGGRSALGERAGEDHGQGAAHAALAGDEVGPGGDGAGFEGEHRHRQGVVPGLGQRPHGVGAAGRRPVAEGVVGRAEAAGLQDRRVRVEGGAVPQVGRQEVDERRGAGAAEPAEEGVGGGGGPAVGETVGDHEEDPAAASVEEFGRVGRAPAGPAQHGGAGAREGDGGGCRGGRAAGGPGRRSGRGGGAAAVAPQRGESPSVPRRKTRPRRPARSWPGPAGPPPVPRSTAVPVRGRATRRVRTLRKAPLCSAARASRVTVSSQIRMVGASSASSTRSKAAVRAGRRNGSHIPSARPCSAVVSSSSSWVSREGTWRASWCRARASRAVRRPGPCCGRLASGSSGAPTWSVVVPSGWGNRPPSAGSGTVPAARPAGGGRRGPAGPSSGLRPVRPSGSGSTVRGRKSAGSAPCGDRPGPGSGCAGPERTVAVAGPAAGAATGARPVPGPPWWCQYAASHTASATSCQCGASTAPSAPSPPGTDAGGAGEGGAPSSGWSSPSSGNAEPGHGLGTGPPSPDPDARSLGKPWSIQRPFARSRRSISTSLRPLPSTWKPPVVVIWTALSNWSRECVPPASTRRRNRSTRSSAPAGRSPRCRLTMASSCSRVGVRSSSGRQRLRNAAGNSRSPLLVITTTGNSRHSTRPCRTTARTPGS